MIKQLSLSLLASLLLATAAMADGMVGHAAPAGCTGGAFSGGYVGAALGAAWQKEKTDLITVNAAAGGSDHDITFGGYAGYNFQRCDSRLLIGIETDFNYIGTDASGREIELGGLAPETTTVTSRLDWFGTLRARVGIVVHDNVLLYGTGGLAYARVDQSIYDDCLNCVYGFNQGTFYQSDSKTKVGWTLGGGAEIAHDDRWLLRAEALYVDLGDNDRTYTVTVPGFLPNNAETKWDDQFWVARLGLTYRFGSREEAVPLK